jgi:hypothetical protein
MTPKKKESIVTEAKATKVSVSEANAKEEKEDEKTEEKTGEKKSPGAN